MPATRLVPRLATTRLREALADSPVVVVHGPRQCGKTTLAQMVCAPGELEGHGNRGYQWTWGQTPPVSSGSTHAYVTFDDPVAADAARNDPMGFVDGLPPNVVLDEVQRVPQLYPAIKLAVDRDRRPGRFVLTGSTNLLLLPLLADSLVGRMEIVRLHPFAQSELASDTRTDFGLAGGLAAVEAHSDFLDVLFGDGFVVERREREGTRLAERIAAADSGAPDPPSCHPYPAPRAALALPSPVLGPAQSGLRPTDREVA